MAIKDSGERRGFDTGAVRDTPRRTLSFQAMKNCRSALERQIPQKPLNPCGRYGGSTHYRERRLML